MSGDVVKASTERPIVPEKVNPLFQLQVQREIFRKAMRTGFAYELYSVCIVVCTILGDRGIRRSARRPSIQSNLERPIGELYALRWEIASGRKPRPSAQGGPCLR